MYSLRLFTLLASATSALSAAIQPEFPVNSSSEYNCTPSQSCWPPAATWQAFNKTISGHLRATVMLGSSCFSSSSNFNNDTCVNIQKNYNNPDFREQTYGEMAYTEWETCGVANCLPSVLAPQSQTCSLGRMSAYYVDAKSVADVIATVQFIKAHNIRLTIKNTGHDFLGRSSAPNTLALWTANLKTLEYKANFTARNCPAADGPNIGIMGAGVVAHDAVNFFLEYGMDVTVGACSTVGIAGGFGQSGGHGAFGPSYGLMVDQAVEFEVVTADGVLRTINECNHPDLFWAMRGGGGGTYAILLKYKFKVYPKKALAMYTFMANISSSAIPIQATKSQILNDTVTALAKNQIHWSDNGMAGYDFLHYDSIETHQILPGDGDVVGRLRDLTAEWTSFIRNYPGYEIVQDNFTLFENQSAYELGTADIIARNNEVGVGALPASRLVSRDYFTGDKNINVLVGGVLQGIENASKLNISDDRINFGIYKVTPANTPDIHHKTSANLAWRTALWHVIVDGGWEQGFPEEDINAVKKYVREGLKGLSNVLDTQAAYTNEADYGEPEWEQVFFGENYDRLLEIKKKYDPTSLFNCWKCVGWLGEEEEMYSCYGDIPQPTIPFLV